MFGFRQNGTHRGGCMLARFILQASLCLYGCADPELIRRGDAKALELLIGRLIIHAEKQPWRHIEPAIGACRRDFTPKHCSPAKLIELNASGQGYEAVYAITVGDRCNAVRDGIQMLRERPKEFAGLHDSSEPNMQYLIEGTPVKTEQTHRTLISSQNSKFKINDHEEFFFSRYLKLIDKVHVDCGAGRITLLLRSF
jgi:hypothetical protein